MNHVVSAPVVSGQIVSSQSVPAGNDADEECHGVSTRSALPRARVA